MSRGAKATLARIAELSPRGLVATSSARGEATLRTEAHSLVPLLQLLQRDETLQLDVLADLTAVDRLRHRPRFLVVYHLASSTTGHRVRVKVGVEDEGEALESATPLWPAANWLEREVSEFYGLSFHNHPDPGRLLLDPDFDGHPLRKDFPRAGRSAPTREG